MFLLVFQLLQLLLRLIDLWNMLHFFSFILFNGSGTVENLLIKIDFSFVGFIVMYLVICCDLFLGLIVVFDDSLFAIVCDFAI